MASKRGQKRRKCQRKHRFTNEADAVKAAIDMRKKHPGSTLDAYRCGLCGGWHVGNRPKRVQQSINSRKEDR